MAITKEDVQQAVEQLKVEGVDKPSAGKVRALMGTGGMGTIQKYLKELREDEAVEEATDTEQQQIEAVTVDPAMVADHVKTIIEHVTTATRSTYLQQLIELDAKVEGLEVELTETKQNYEELAADFEQQVEQNKGLIDSISDYQDRIMGADLAIEQLKDEKINAELHYESRLEQAQEEHEKEVLALKAANKQLEAVIESITKRIGVAPEAKEEAKK